QLPDHWIAAVDGKAVETRVELAAADSVNDDVHDFTMRQVAHFSGEVLAVTGDDHVVRANAEEELALCGAWRDGNHACTACFCDLDAGNADTASGAGHQDRFTYLDPGRVT